ncbi:11258_t:CDS:1 [Acaulospora morrowiae]|uniref:11258_t:CDS:1 n=1 Tax=Acaulospora morrowiae TaxID=94023 RepID=A0A9N9HBK1_9GLOM|nr:11258_t:CDS:1 [Acaulospora morrowiae]
MASNNDKYKELSETACREIEKDRQNSALARYERGMRNNFFSNTHKKNFGIDAAFCIFTDKSRTLCPDQFSIFPEYFNRIRIPENTRLKGFYTYEDFDDIDKIDVFKVGKGSGLSCGKLIPDRCAVSFDITNKSINFAKKQDPGEISQAPSSTDLSDKVFIGYMKSPIFENRQKCYPTVWFDRQLIIKFEFGGFECGDSGSSIVDERGKALGILHAVWLTSPDKYAIASPYFAVFEALDIEECKLD